MEYGWRGSPHHFAAKQGPTGSSSNAVQRMLQEEDARLRGGQPSLKKVTWPPPPEDFEIEDGEQEPVYSQQAPAINGFVSPTPQYAQQQGGRVQNQQQLQQQVPPPQQTRRRSTSRDRSRASPAWTPPPTVITLRQSPPLNQAPAPVVVSQPATARMQATVQNSQDSRGLQNGGLNRMDSTPGTSPTPGKPARITAKNRGDLKWPPEDCQVIPETINFEVPVAKIDEPIVKESGIRARGDAKWPPAEYKTRADEENAMRVALAKGPVCRPRRVQKDYSTFFAQNQVNDTYPGYRAPPGTQHYLDETGISEF